MSRKISDLIPVMQEKAHLVVKNCKDRGVDILIYYTQRSLQEQGEMYRKGRSWAEIEEKISNLRLRGFGYLADIIIEVGPQNGDRVTNAAPGESWHNFREAFDGVPIENGVALWNDTEKYEIYGECVMDAGLNWGGKWTSFVDLPHAQSRFNGNPLRTFSPQEAWDILNEYGVIQ